MKDVTIVIPIYKDKLEHSESISLDACLKIFKKYDITIIKPSNIEVPHGVKKNVRICNFDNYCFSSIDSYNQLMLTSKFYQTFRNYRYILIYQLDAFAFSDQLQMWCDTGYDYIGAPWIDVNWPDSIMNMVHKPFYADLYLYKKIFYKNDNSVGNGGFSLRKVSSALLTLKLLGKYAAKWPLNEDIFWSIFVPNVLPWYSVPSHKLAASFSLELHPRKGIVLNEGRMPFGCHAWEKHDFDFWKPHISAMGYRI